MFHTVDSSFKFWDSLIASVPSDFVLESFETNDWLLPSKEGLYFCFKRVMHLEVRGYLFEFFDGDWIDQQSSLVSLSLSSFHYQLRAIKCLKNCPNLKRLSITGVVSIEALQEALA